METTSLCFNTCLGVNKNFQLLINFKEINVKICIILEDLTVNKYFITHLHFLFQLIFFSHFEELKSTFFTSLHFVPRGMY